MSQYGLIYRMELNDMEASVSTTVDIIDTSVVIDDSAEITVISLRPAGNPLTISVINNDRDKFTPIRAKQATIRFLSERNNFLDLTTFSDVPDNNYLVHIYTNTPTFIFKGFLMLTDMQQPFQPDPVQVVLTASDHLGLLNDIPFSETGLTGKQRIAAVLAGCLLKTGLTEEINVINNLRHGSGSRTMEVTFQDTDDQLLTAPTRFFYPGQTVEITGTLFNNGTFHVDAVGLLITTIAQFVEPVTNEANVNATFTDVSSDGHFYDKVYVDADDLSDLSCREVIERILGQDCFLTQWKGEWWIMRVDEFDGNGIFIGLFTAQGEFSSITGPTAIDMSIGVGEAKFFCNADQIQSSDRPHKVVDLRLDYDTRNLLCNDTFESGALITQVSDLISTFEIDCWGSYRANFPTSDLIAPTTNIYTRRDYINGSEVERYVVIEQNSGIVTNLIMSRPVFMGQTDKFNITMSRRLSANQSGSGDYSDILGQVRLYGNDGTFYTLFGGVTTDVTPRWVASNSTFTTANQQITYQGQIDEDQTETVSKTVEAPPLPVDGYIRVLLYQSGEWGDVADTYHEPPTLEYIPFINGTYQKYNSQSSIVTRDPDAGYHTKREEQIYLGDLPKPSLRGAMYIPSKINSVIYTGSIQFTTTGFVLSGNVASTYPAGLPIYIESAGNTGFYQVVSSTYNVIGNTTAVTTNVDTTLVTEAGVIYRGAYYLTTQFYTAAPFALGPPPDDDYIHPYNYIQAYSVWNQYNNAYRIFTGSVKNLGTSWPDLLHKYTLTDSDPNTDNRYFMLISFSQDWKLGLWTGVFVEVYRTDLGKVYTDTFTFRYNT